MKDNLLLLLESMFLPERRHCLPKLIRAIETQQADEATAIFHEQLNFLNKLKGKDINIVRDTTREDMGDFTWLLKKSKRTLLGRLRLADARESRKEANRIAKIRRQAELRKQHPI